MPSAAPVAARAYVLGALIFSARDDRSFDPARAAAHVECAESLLAEGDQEQRVFLVFARVAAARHLGARAELEAYRAYAATADQPAILLNRASALPAKTRVSSAAGMSRPSRTA